MFVCVYTLLLLAHLLSLCGATVYYVRPTESSNATCPDQPCFTIDYYSKHSDHYIKSNTEFRFLPGIHRIKKPFVIKDAENIVLEASTKHNDTHPQLVAQFPCQNVIEEDNCITLQLFKHVRVYIHVCRSVLSVTNATQVTINGISISVETSVVSAVTLQQCSHVHIMSINLTSNDEQCDNSPTSEGTNVGVLAYMNVIMLKWSFCKQTSSLMESYCTTPATLISLI